MAANQLSSNIDVIQFVGSFQYGILTNWALLGFLAHQVYVYHTRFAKMDRLFFKILVNSVLLLELMFSGFMTHLVHGLVVSGWGEKKIIESLPKSAVMLPASTSVMALIVQAFFLWRLWKINVHSNIIRGFVCLGIMISCTHFACSVALTHLWNNHHHLSNSAGRKDRIHRALTVTALVGAFTTDVFITGLMVLSLTRIRRKSTAVKSSVMTLNMLIIRAIETGIVTTLAAMVELILYVHPKLQHSSAYIAFAVSLGKCYSTMLLANLNGRGQFSGAQEPFCVDTSYGLELTDAAPQVSSRVITTTVLVTTEVDVHDESFLGKRSTEHNLNDLSSAVYL